MNSTLTYFATHSLPRTATGCEDADAIIDSVNRSTASSGDSLHRDRVQAELDATASRETQELLGITVESVADID